MYNVIAQLVVATGSGNLIYLTIGEHAVEELNCTKLEHEIACAGSSHPHAFAHAHTHARTHMHSFAFTPTPTRTRTRTHTNACTHTPALTRTHTHPARTHNARTVHAHL